MTPKHIAECVSRMMPIECGIPEEAKIFSLLFEGYLPIVFVIAGGLCNGMSLVVLLDGPFLDLFNKLLVTLAICDSFFLGKFFYAINNDLSLSKFLSPFERRIVFKCF